METCCVRDCGYSFGVPTVMMVQDEREERPACPTHAKQLRRHDRWELCACCERVVPRWFFRAVLNLKNLGHAPFVWEQVKSEYKRAPNKSWHKILHDGMDRLLDPIVPPARRKAGVAHSLDECEHDRGEHRTQGKARQEDHQHIVQRLLGGSDSGSFAMLDGGALIGPGADNIPPEVRKALETYIREQLAAGTLPHMAHVEVEMVNGEVVVRPVGAPSKEPTPDPVIDREPPPIPDLFRRAFTDDPWA